MAIHVECEACGESLSLKEAAAGKRVKCRCGAAISVPQFDDVQPLDDDSDGDYSSLRRRGSRRRGGNSEQLIKFAVFGGGGVIGLLALIFSLLWAFGAPRLKQDFTLLGELGPEQAGAGYVIRPPQGFLPGGTSHSGHSSPIGEIVSDGAVWKGESGKIAITVTQNANIRGKVRPTIHTSSSMFADMSGEPEIGRAHV